MKRDCDFCSHEWERNCKKNEMVGMKVVDSKLVKNFVHILHHDAI